MASFPRLPNAGPEVTDLGDEPPAISNLLVHRWKLTRAAMPATLLDLAARRLLGIDMLDRDHFVMRVRARDGDADNLNAYERQIFDWVKSRATGGSAPFEALDLGEAGQAQSFWKRFQKNVISDARKRGLVRSRWSRNDWVVIGALLAISFGLLALAFGQAGIGQGADDPVTRGDWLIYAGLGWFGVMAVITRFQDLRDTPKGQEVCARWLGVRNALRKSTAFDEAPPSHVIIWERNLSHAVAMGLAHEAAKQLPFDEEDPETAWSRHGGTWREIQINYPERFGFGSKPLGVMLGGLMRMIFFGGIAFVVLPIVGRVGVDLIHEIIDATGENTTTMDRQIALVVAVFVAFLCAWGIFLTIRFVAGVIRFWRGLSDLGKSETVEGEVVKLHLGRVAVDDGKAEETTAWIPQAQSPAITRGMRVRYTRTPNLWYISNITVLALPGGAPPRSAAQTRAARAGSGLLAGNLAAINAATGLALAPLAAHGDSDSGEDDVDGADIGGFGGPGIESQAFSDGKVNVFIATLASGAAGPAGMLLNFAARATARKSPPLTGVGDSAWWMGEDNLIVQDGGRHLMVRVTGPEATAERQRIAQTIGRTLVEGGPASPAANAKDTDALDASS